MNQIISKIPVFLFLSLVFLISSCGDDDTEIVNTITFNVTNQGAGAFIFNGNSFNNTLNPDISLVRGNTYAFVIDAPGHPFLIKSVQGSGVDNQYNNGVTNAGAVDGTVTFTVPEDAPNTLFYNCQFHTPMTGTFNITG